MNLCRLLSATLQYLAVITGIFLLSLQAPAAAGAQPDFDTAFQRGNTAYAEQDYAAALEAYQHALTAGQSAALHHNLGNTYSQLGHGGHAAAHYRKSLALDPRNPDTRANLQQTHQALGRNPPSIDISQRIAELLPVNVWTSIALSAFWVGLFAILFPRLFRWRPLPTWTLRAVSAIALGLAMVALLGYHYLAQMAIVVGTEVPLRPSPTQHSEAGAYVQEGENVRLGEQFGQFSHITLPSGRSGWVEHTQIMPIWDGTESVHP